jgi:hypothetical protein
VQHGKVKLIENVFLSLTPLQANNANLLLATKPTLALLESLLPDLDISFQVFTKAKS